MKAKLISSLKIILPLSFGVFLIWLFYDALCEDQKAELFQAFAKANYWWVVLALLFGFASHLSRAYRWKFLLDPMGYKISFVSSYHAVMIGYLVNLVFPRAGEASRAGILAKSENVPFQKGFGSILAERAVDVFMLGIIVLITIVLKLDKISIFQSKISWFNSPGQNCGNTAIFSFLGSLVTYGILIGFVVAIVLFIIKPKFRSLFTNFVKGMLEGILSIFRTKYKLYYLGHTVFIWVMYILMFSVCFFAVDSTAVLGIDAMLAGFVAGTIGIILVQGGIGVFPAFVGLILTTYLAPLDNSGIVPDALALGWIIWTSQTLLVILLGLVSLILSNRNLKIKQHESSSNLGG